MPTLRPDRIRARLEALGLSANEAARRMGGFAIQNILAGKQRDTKLETAERIASILRTSHAYLTGETDEAGLPDEGRFALAVEGDVLHQRAPPVNFSRQRQPGIARLQPSKYLLRVRHTIEAGAWLEPRQRDESGPPVAADPRFPADRQWLELVRGDAPAPPGSWAHVVDAESTGYVPRVGDVVVVVTAKDGLEERSVSKVTPEADGRPAPIESDHARIAGYVIWFISPP